MDSGGAMASSKRNGELETRTARKKLLPRKEPYWTVLERGRSLGYYRPRDRSAGTWIARLHDPDTGKKQMRRLASADDYAEPDGQELLSYAQAQVRAREWFDLARLALGEDTPRRGPFTVRDAWILYRNDAQRRGVRALSRLDCAWTLWIEPEFGNMEVERLTQDRIERWHHAMSLEAPRVRRKKFASGPAKGSKPETEDQLRKRKVSANRVLTIFRSALNFAKRKRKVMVSADLWREVKPFERVDAARLRFLTLEEQQRLVNACDPDFRRLVQGALFTGARAGELARLQAKDFDPLNGSVFIAQSKSGKPRHVFLAQEGVEFFKAQAAGLKPEDLLFTHEAFGDMRRVEADTLKPVPKIRRGWRHGDYLRRWRRVCEEAKVGALTFHELRHTYASALLNAGVPMVFIAAQLGHSDTRMVEKHYGHLSPSALKDAIRTLAPTLGIFEPGKVEGLRIRKDGSGT